MVDGDTRGAEAIVENFSDDDYMIQVDVEHNTGYREDILFRYTDANNFYGLQINRSPAIAGLYKVENGISETWDGCFYTTGEPMAVKIKADGSSLKAWINGSLCKSVTDSTHAAGGVALRGEDAKFDNLEIGYDDNDDDDIDDAGDDLAVDEDFGSTSCTVAHDHAGNLIDP